MCTDTPLCNKEPPTFLHIYTLKPWETVFLFVWTELFSWIEWLMSFYLKWSMNSVTISHQRTARHHFWYHASWRYYHICSFTLRSVEADRENREWVVADTLSVKCHHHVLKLYYCMSFFLISYLSLLPPLDFIKLTFFQMFVLPLSILSTLRPPHFKWLSFFGKN